MEEFWVVNDSVALKITYSTKIPRAKDNQQEKFRNSRPLEVFARVDNESYNLKFRQCSIWALCGLIFGYETI